MRKLCVNYTCGGSFNEATVTADALRLYGEGVRYVRVHISNYQDSAQVLRDLQTCAVFSSIGFYVIWGITSNNYLPEYTITTSNINDFRDAVYSYASIAPTYGVNEYVVGNEEELHNDGVTVLDNDIVVALLSWAATAKTNFGGIVSTNHSQGADSIWTQKGNFDRMGTNLYWDGDKDLFISRLLTNVSRFGDNLYIAEYGPYSDWSDETDDERIEADIVRKMRESMDKNGVTEYYFFTYVNRTDSDKFAARESDESYRQMWGFATSQRRWI